MLRRSPLALLLVAVILMPTLAWSNPKERIPIAVSYFANTGEDKSLDVLKKGLADMLTTDLSVADDLVLVEREQLELALAEIRLQKNPFFDKAGAVRLGKGLGAEFIVTGGFVRLDNQLRIDLKVIDVADGTIVYAVQKTGKDGAVFKLQAELAKALLSELGARLSRIQAKRLGRGGPRHIRSLKTYGKALEAADAGKRKQAEKLLRETLAADPEFTRVQSRIETLEAQVSVLAKSGGLILKPTTSGDFLHNYRLQRERGAREPAAKSLESAIRAAPSKLDGWLALGSEGASAKIPRNVTLSPGMRSLVRNYLDKNQAALKKSLATKNSAAAALFLFDLSKRDLPSANLSPYLYAQAAMAHMSRASLSPLVGDPEKHLESVRQIQRRYFDGKDDGKSGSVTFREGGNIMQMGVWSQWIGLDESPKGDVTVTLSRSRHPSWKSKPRLPPFPHKHKPATKRELAQWPHIFEARRKAQRTRNGYVWLVRHPIHGGTKLVQDTAARLGDRISVPSRAFTCKDSNKSLTGKRCSTVLELTADMLAPGQYNVQISYTGHDGVIHTNRVDTWFRDIYLHRSTPLGRRSAKSLYHSFASLDGKDGAKLRKEVSAGLVGMRRFKVAALAHVNTYWRGHTAPAPNDKFERLHSLFLDIDYGLLGGSAPKSRQQEKAYRDLLVQKGYELKGSPLGHQYIPLPALSNKPHTICLVAELTNKAVSPQAHCQTFTP